MEAPQIDFAGVVTIGTTVGMVLVGIAGHYYKEASILEKRNQDLEIDLKESAITKSLSTVADTVKQISDNQNLLKESLNRGLAEAFERIRIIELEHAGHCGRIKQTNNYDK
jgi:hypothetical protein